VEHPRFNLYIDYAHTEDALMKVLEALHTIRLRSGGKMLLVFGCGGDRDRVKRAPMGRVGEIGADQVVVTTDNPRSEDPMKICREIWEGFSFPERHRVILDRREAIRYAISQLKDGDFLLVAGKGHETTQWIGQDLFPFDDALVVKELVREGLCEF
jgi:UDP-N-acetylmuramoyl-L-alanyl-D-glutamate--2,6-diaminopimelate ligase